MITVVAAMRQESENLKLEACRRLMAQSAFGRKLLAIASEMDIPVTCDRREQELARFNRNCIFYNAKASAAALAAGIAHEIIHAWQERNGFWPDESLSPEDAILAVRLTEAIAQTGSLIMCRELELAGWTEPMRVHEGMGYGAQVNALRETASPEKTFLAWFDVDWCLNRYDSQTILDLMDREDELRSAKERGFTPMTQAVLAGMCSLPGRSPCIDTGLVRAGASVFSGNMSPGNAALLGRLERSLRGERPSQAEEEAEWRRAQAFAPSVYALRR